MSVSNRPEILKFYQGKSLLLRYQNLVSFFWSHQFATTPRRLIFLQPYLVVQQTQFCQQSVFNSYQGPKKCTWPCLPIQRETRVTVRLSKIESVFVNVRMSNSHHFNDVNTVLLSKRVSAIVTCKSGRILLITRWHGNERNKLIKRSMEYLSYFDLRLQFR